MISRKKYSTVDVLKSIHSCVLIQQISMTQLFFGWLCLVFENTTMNKYFVTLVVIENK